MCQKSYFDHLGTWYHKLSDQIEQYLRQQREIAHQHASILVLQMRPHFIHNTLMNIYYLCRQDPAEAQRVTLDFNTFLERNLNVLASDETIPFSDNGPGFAPAQEGGPHIALQNIRQRLELMCGGTMSILPREGGGTIVKLTIPGSAPENGA